MYILYKYACKKQCLVLFNCNKFCIQQMNDNSSYRKWYRWVDVNMIHGTGLCKSTKNYITKTIGRTVASYSHRENIKLGKHLILF